MGQHKHKDPIFEESQFCPECEPKALDLVEYVRALENAQIVAKQALETINMANQKLTRERQDFVKRIKTLEDKLTGKSQRELKTKMESIQAAHERFVNRGKIFDS